VPSGKRREAVIDELEVARLWVADGPVWVIDVPKEEERDLSAIRSEAGRRGGRKSAEVRRETHGTAQPRSKLEPNAEASSKQLGFAAEATGRSKSELGSKQGPDPSSPLELSSPDSSGFPSDSGSLAASPDPEPAESFSHVGAAKPKRRWRRCPAEWTPTDEHRQLARERGVDFETELAKFRDHEFATGKSDANGTFRNWLRNARTTALALPTRQAPGSNFDRLAARAVRLAEEEKRNAAQ
jgi:hypothetical protein